MKVLSEIYEEACQNGTLRSDPAQVALLPLFDQLMLDLEEQKSRQLFSWLRKPPPLKGIYIWGKIGRGKTLLMDLFQSHAPVPTLRNHTNLFLHQHFFKAHEKAEKGQTEALFAAVKKIAGQAKVLCLDEFQIDHIADAMLLSRSLSLAFKQGIVLLATSNTHPKNLYANGLHRERFIPFIDTLLEHVQVVCLEGEDDYRMHEGGVKSLYLLTSDTETPKILEKIWDLLTQQAPTRVGEIQHQKRILRLSRFANKVGWATFEELCGRPLGSADYRALIHNISYLILSDIPKLSPHQFNEATRFIKLIDLLYEAKIVTIFSGDVPIHALYPVGRGTDMFGRTRSRLQEMRSWKMPFDMSPTL
ncbi:MAG: cell division protein ZapE [Alphaproteobacteria bacterium]